LYLKSCSSCMYYVLYITFYFFYLSFKYLSWLDSVKVMNHESFDVQGFLSSDFLEKKGAIHKV
jgi:hypothetical protein